MSSPTHKNHFYTHISLVILALLACSGVIYGAINYSEYFPNSTTIFQSQANGWATSTGGVAKEIMTPEGCRKITSTASSKMFIPTNTLTEWASFRDHLPSGVSTATCINQYPGCNTPDIVLTNGQIWAACNVGSTVAGTTAASYGSFFQWGRNVAFPSTGTVTTTAGPLSLAAANATLNYITNATAPYDWLNPQDGNRWGGGTNPDTVTYQTALPANQALMQGPCATGYHVPTYAEANSTVAALPGTLLASTLMVPTNSGYRANNNGAVLFQGVGTIGSFWWLASPLSTYGRNWNGLGGTNFNPDYSLGRAYGLQVRCLKNEVIPCNGSVYGGYCWYLANFGETCDTFCSGHGGCNTTGITNVNNSTYCNALIPLVAPGAGIDANAYADNRIPACTTLTIVTVTNALINNVNPTTCSTPITVTPGNRKRVCSCNN